MKQCFSQIIVAIVTVSVMFAALILGDLLEAKYIFLAIIVSVLFPAFVLAVQFFDTYRKAKLIRDEFPQETILFSKPATIYMDYQEVHLFLTNKQLHILNPNQNNHIDSYPYEDILDFEVTDFIIIILKIKMNCYCY